MIRSIVRDGGATRGPVERVEIHFLADGYSILDAVNTYWRPDARQAFSGFARMHGGVA